MDNLPVGRLGREGESCVGQDDYSTAAPALAGGDIVRDLLRAESDNDATLAGRLFRAVDLISSKLAKWAMRAHRTGVSPLCASEKKGAQA